ncbi:NAD(P)H-hydrate dehydratase [Pedobacter sp. HMWF019]|uniref:NAD(P)H-hydrate dehydratase n=1 Tax=Pedobacter sp. HMWF019 TaxID=2056856 RepID=UPI000D3AFE03|nr:NAD(P)H-hydrate dehydratase [Pedobacter sp. HMWF019]PTS91394.1 NAD(P)H-hydrate dehydratase [Pedobacter sp. HMWF019]
MKNDLNNYLPDRSAPGSLKDQLSFQLVKPSAIRKIFKSRQLFSHKGTYGHALILAGAEQTMGAAILSAKGCLYAGAGLTTLSIPESGLTALNTCLPEIMYLDRKTAAKDSELKDYQSIAIGPGLSTVAASLELLIHLLKQQKALIIDADALNLLALHREWIPEIPSGSILTPHMKEFDRLFGEHRTWFERLNTAVKKAKELNCLILLKNQYTFVVNEQGKIFINTTGNPAMAQGGMGDVLTGILAAYRAQGYSNEEAAVLGCYFHGLAGDSLAENEFNVTASQVAEHLPAVVKKASFK